jgi:hypothetical protein
VKATFQYVKEILREEAAAHTMLCVTHSKPGWIEQNKNKAELQTILDFCKLGAVEVNFPPFDDDLDQENLYKKKRESSFNLLLEMVIQTKTNPFVPALALKATEEQKWTIMNGFGIFTRLGFMIDKYCTLI